METTLGSVTPKALQLSSEEKCLLAARLLRSVEPQEKKDWETVIGERISAYDEGNLETSPVEDSIARVRQQHLG